MLARRLAAYLPLTLTRQVVSQSMPTPGVARWITAATIFADLSGFTAMSEELATDGPRGAEELNRTLLLTFTPMINAIHDAGGAVAHFHGDAMMVYFPDDDGRAAQRALACARFMQGLMLTSFSRVITTRPARKNAVFDLTIRLGVGYGRCLEMVVGESEIGLEFVLAGTAVGQAVAAQQQAEAGQVVASRDALINAGLPATGPYRLVTEVAPVPNASASLYWEAFESESLNRLLKIAPAFLPPALYARLQDHNIHSVAEHRPATSIFVRFEGIDYEAENADRLLQHYYLWARRIVARYGGENSHVNRLLTGDKGSQLHIIFGAPVAPDAPEQAVRCALALQREKPAFITRQQIGLATGRVFACAVGSQNRREYTIVGRVVNLSAHLTQVCRDGAVVTDTVTAARVDKLIEFEVLPPMRLKGQVDAAPLYRAMAERPASTQLQARFTRWQHPPVGREKEVALLRQRMEAAWQGQGNMVAITGAIGSGQVRLLATGVCYWLAANGIGLLGICQQHMRDVPFGPWQSIWRDLFGLTAELEPQAQAAAVISRIQSLCPNDDPAWRDGSIALWLQAMGLPATDLPIPDADNLTQLPAELRQARLFRRICDVLTRIAAERPLLLVLEDIHWADQLSLALLDEMAQSLHGFALSIVVTSRPVPDFVYPTLNRPICTVIPLGDLAPQQARQLIKQLVGVERLPLTLEQRLGLYDHNGRASPVNPLFLKESLKMMLSLGILRVEKDMLGRERGYVNEKLLAQMQLPDTIYTLLLAQLDRLSAPARGLLQVAAVIGREFNLSTLVAATPGMTRPLATTLLEQLETAKLVQLVTVEPEPVYVFQHTLMHDVVYQSLPYARRQAHHAAIADLLVMQHAANLRPLYPILAYHYSQAGRHQEGLEVALAAAEDAAAIFANQEAAELYKLAALHLEAVGEREHWQSAVQVRVARAQVLRLLGQFTDAAVTAVHALQLSLVYSQGDPAQTIPAYNLLARMQYHRGRYSHVQTLTTRALNSATDDVPSDALIQTYLFAGMAAAAQLDQANALGWLQKAEALCTTAVHQPDLALIWSARGLVYTEQQAWEPAVGTVQSAAALARQVCVPAQLGLILNDLAYVYLRCGQPRAALDVVEEAVSLMRGTGQNLLARALTRRAAVLLYLGRLADARADLEVATELLEAMDDGPGQAELYLLWAEMELMQNSLSQARHRFAQAEKLLINSEEWQGLIRLSLGLAHVALRVNQVEQAAVLAERALQMSETYCLSWWRPDALYIQGLAALAGARPDSQALQKGRNYLQAALEAVQDGGCADYLPLILLQLAKVEFDTGRRWHYLAQCITAAQSRSRYQDRIRCFRVAGAILAQADDPHLRQLGATCLFEVSRFDLSQDDNERVMQGDRIIG